MSELPEGTQTVVMGIGDLNGLLRGKRIPASHWPVIAEEGMVMSNAMLALDMTCDIWDTPYTNMATGYPDLRVRPLSGIAHSMPWDPGAAFVFGRAETEAGDPVPIDPRNVLAKVTARAAAMGYEVKIGAELEFFLLDPETLRPRDTGIQVYGLERAMELEHVLGPIRNDLVTAGIPIEQSNPEYAPGQVEVNIRFGEALETADRVVAFRGMVKQLAIAHGYRATFMAKPFIDLAGSGFHVHHSLWKDGENVFASDAKLSDTGRAYLGGMRSRIVESSVCAASTPNAYRRRQPDTFCPINDTWGYDNRTISLRVLEGHPHSTRIEQRDGSADTNPYLLLATQIAAGLDGIDNDTDPGDPELGDGYRNPEAAPIPTDLATALTAARSSEWLAELLGEDLLGVWLGQAERELEFVAAQVTPVEVERYLGNF
ncbi:glutamine synthetase family protein [soil metagenome]